MTLVLDSGGLSWLSGRSPDALELLRSLHRRGATPPVVPTVVLAESLSGRARTDVGVNRLLKLCDVREVLTEPTARRTGALRARAGRGSAVDAIVIALAEPDGAVLTSDARDLRALAAHADRVRVEAV